MTTAGAVIQPDNLTSLMPVKPTNSSGHFMWDIVPDFVIGRPGYDNWLVAQALRWNVTLSVDFTRTVLAIHQTGPDGTKSGFTAKRNRHTLNSNYELAGRYYKFAQGVTTCLPWISGMSSEGNITFIARQHRMEVCTQPDHRSPRRHIITPYMRHMLLNRHSPMRRQPRTLNFNVQSVRHFPDSLKGQRIPPMWEKYTTTPMIVTDIPLTSNNMSVMSV